MDYINKDCTVSKVLNLGDFIQIGPNPREVYDIVMNHPKFINIMGNSEYMFFNDEVRRYYETEVEHQDWVCKQLGLERMENLKKVPLQRTVTIENRKFLMVHARMNNVMDTPLLYGKKTLRRILRRL